MKRLILIWSLLGCLCCPAAMAQSALLTPQMQGDVAFVSGGVGRDERDELQAQRSHYNLNLLFSMKGSGEYLSDVGVKVSDANGQVCLDTVANGPILLAKLKPGRYTVSVDRESHVINKTIMVDAKQHTPLSFTWTDH